MKSIMYAAVFILSFASYSAYGQLYLGGKVGYNAGNTVADQNIENIINVKTLHGVTGGAILGYTFSDLFDLQGELNITQKGFRIDEATDFQIFGFPMEVGVDYFSRFTYLELPILAKLKLGNDIVKGYAAVGPQLGYMVKGRMKANANVIIPVTILDTELDLQQNNFKRLEFAGVAALGVLFNLGNVANLFVEGRYTHGFTDYYQLPKFGAFQLDTDIQNRNIAATVGVTFPLGAAKAGNARGGRF